MANLFIMQYRIDSCFHAGGEKPERRGNKKKIVKGIIVVMAASLPMLAVHSVPVGAC